MEYQYWLAYHAETIGIQKINRLIEQGYTAEQIYHLADGQKIQIEGISGKDIYKIEESRKKWNFNSAKDVLDHAGIRLVTQEQSAYPKKLRGLWDRPYGLFVKGRLPDEKRRSVAIVGARMCSEYGRAIAGSLGEKLANGDIQIISGMALGIDSAGHYGALRGNGNTYAVLGCGLDICYPAANRTLYEKIVTTGGILSEYPPQTTPQPYRFPMRNRIISGLSDIVIVVEAKEKSGSLITADYALEQGREIYAVPGRLTDPGSGGCNRLIKQGSGIIVAVEDFMKDLEIFLPEEPAGKNFKKNLLEKEETLVYALLDLQPKSISEIISETEMEIQKAMAILAGLQKKGLIQEIFKNYYIRTLR